MRDGRTVGVAHHVVMKDDAAHARQLGAAGLEWIFRAFGCLLGALFDLVGNGPVVGLVKAAARPVTMRTENAGPLATGGITPPAPLGATGGITPPAPLGATGGITPPAPLGAIEVAADIMAGIAGKKYFFDRVFAAVDFAVDDGLQRRLFRHRPQTEGDEHLL